MPGFGILAGKKTYITGILGLLTALGAYLTGDAASVEALQLALTSLLGITIRGALKDKNGTPK